MHIIYPIAWNVYWRNTYLFLKAIHILLTQWMRMTSKNRSGPSNKYIFINVFLKCILFTQWTVMALLALLHVNM